MMGRCLRCRRRRELRYKLCASCRDDQARLPDTPPDTMGVDFSSTFDTHVDTTPAPDPTPDFGGGGGYDGSGAGGNF